MFYAVDINASCEELSLEHDYPLGEFDSQKEGYVMQLLYVQLPSQDGILLVGDHFRLGWRTVAMSNGIRVTRRVAVIGTCSHFKWSEERLIGVLGVTHSWNKPINTVERSWIELDIEFCIDELTSGERLTRILITP